MRYFAKEKVFGMLDAAKRLYLITW